MQVDSVTRQRWLDGVGVVLDKLGPRDAAVIGWDAAAAVQQETVRRLSARIALARGMVSDDAEHEEAEVLSALDGSHPLLNETLTWDQVKQIFPMDRGADETEVVGDAQDERSAPTGANGTDRGPSRGG